MRIRQFNLLATLVAVSFLLNTSSALAKTSSREAYPRLVSGQKNPDCQLVLKAAKLAFESESNHYSNAGDAVRGKTKTVVVWPSDEGSEIGFDEGFVDCPPPEPFKGIYLQKQPSSSSRFLLRRIEFNWQGDWHDILAVRCTESDNSKLNDVIHDKDLDKKKAADVVMSNAWQRPWLFRNPANNSFIAVDTQHPAEFMADWLVYTIDKNGKAVKSATIRFRPGTKGVAQEVPPGRLRELRDLLDQIAGIPKVEEGTLHPSTRARLRAETSWGNLLYRPWAIEDPYNPRATLDRGLKRWSKGSPVYRQQHNRLQQLYPEALSALSSYYEKHFKKIPAQAKAMAAQALDKVLRSHFIFPSGP